MVAPQDCPEIECWQTLLDADVPPEQFERVERHLESCPNCQDRLDRASEEEEELRRCAQRVGDPTRIKLMGHGAILRGHVDSIARAINVANAQPAAQGVANVNPIFTWVRLAQRIPVRIHIDAMPPGVVLSAGMTATVEIVVGDRGRGTW